MTPLEQAAADLKLADNYVDLFEQNSGKKTTLRRMLREAVMAGIKHGRASAPTSQDRFADMLGRKLF